MKTVLVIGASGFLGSSIVKHFRHKYRVVAGYHRHLLKIPGTSNVTYNLQDRDYMKRVIQFTKPDVIIYCAGVTDFLECHKKPRMAEAVNSFGPVVLSAAADTVSHRFIYLSSAYVYEGDKGNFNENDVVLPETVLGKSKLAGENYVRSKCSTWTVLRFSPIYGIGSIYHPSLTDRIRMKLERGQRVELPENEVHSFLALDIALKAIDWAIQVESRNRLFTLGGLTKISWFEFGRKLANTLGFDENLVVPALGQFTQPVDFSVNGSDLVRQLNIDPLVVEEGLDLFKQQLICGTLLGNT